VSSIERVECEWWTSHRVSLSRRPAPCSAPSCRGPLLDPTEEGATLCSQPTFSRGHPHPLVRRWCRHLLLRCCRRGRSIVRTQFTRANFVSSECYPIVTFSRTDPEDVSRHSRSIVTVSSPPRGSSQLDAPQGVAIYAHIRGCCVRWGDYRSLRGEGREGGQGTTLDSQRATWFSCSSPREITHAARTEGEAPQAKRGRTEPRKQRW
jgi:hypothetical protein